MEHTAYQHLLINLLKTRTALPLETILLLQVEHFDFKNRKLIIKGQSIAVGQDDDIWGLLEKVVQKQKSKGSSFLFIYE